MGMCIGSASGISEHNEKKKKKKIYEGETKWKTEMGMCIGSASGVSADEEKKKKKYIYEGETKWKTEMKRKRKRDIEKNGNTRTQ